jgi:LmbE family N-acetylglucosaminyl deacetylase
VLFVSSWLIFQRAINFVETNLNDDQWLLGVFAHPDDESILAAGAIAHHVSLGRPAALICATRGEWGPISDEKLAHRGNLGEVRERELRAACAILGVTWLRFLDLADGGIAAVIGTEEEIKTLEKIVRAIRELRPQTVITFGQDGLYGHKDHLAIGQLTTQACAMAGDPRCFPQQLSDKLPLHRTPELYYATVPQGLYVNLISHLAKTDQETHLWHFPPENFGVPPEEITTTIDITPFLDRKLAALRCHQTQLDDSHAFTRLTPELAARFFSHEYYRRVIDSEERL